MFSSFSFLGLACYPSGNDMINVQGGKNRTPLLGWQCGTNDVVASNALYRERTNGFTGPLLDSPQDVKGYLSGSHLSICLSSHLVCETSFVEAVHWLVQEAVRHECWHVWTTWHYTLLAARCVHPIPLKGWISVQGHWGVTSGSTVTLSWEINEARAQKGSLRTVHICTNQRCFVTTIFSQLCQMRSEGTNVPHFTHLRRIFTHKQPEETRGTGDAGRTLQISKKYFK